MKRALLYIFLLVLFLAGQHCANPGTPTGGPRDRTPPTLIKSTPEPGATNFDGKIITLVFNENIQVKDADKKFVISPPVLPAPKVEGHSANVRVRMDKDAALMPNTTYTLDFADCVSDLNEGNVLRGFTFSFSTGESKDSMMISGNLYDAETLAPVDGVYILLHHNLSDTALLTCTPVRIAKTDIYGRFEIKNVPADTVYNVFALDDKNRNFIYDSPEERVAFVGERVRPGWEIRQLTDSVRVDSLSQSPDTAQWVYEKVMRDTLVYTPDSLRLFAFAEEAYSQYITDDERKQRNQIRLFFNCPMPSKPPISFPGHGEADGRATLQYSLHNDTVTVWMTDTLIYKKDSVVIATTYPVLDSMKQFVPKTDTLIMWHFEKKREETRAERRAREKAEKSGKVKKQEPPTLRISATASLPDYAQASINIPTPFASCAWDSITLWHKVDTVWKPVKYTAIDDTVNICHKAIAAKWEPGEKYELRIDSAAIRDVYGVCNNKFTQEISVTQLNKFGTLYINLDSVPEHGLLQLLDGGASRVLRQNRVPRNGKAAFRYLKPGDYMIRVLIDENDNGRWDNGDFKAQRLPERFIYYMDKVKVRENWDVKVDFSLGDFSVERYVAKFKAPKVRNNRRF